MASLQNARVIAVARAELGKFGCIGVTLLLPWFGSRSIDAVAIERSKDPAFSICAYYAFNTKV